VAASKECGALVRLARLEGFCSADKDRQQAPRPAGTAAIKGFIKIEKEIRIKKEGRHLMSPSAGRAALLPA
jgi:hypothetical protein